MDSRIPSNRGSIDGDERVQWFGAPHEGTVLVKTRNWGKIADEMKMWSITLTPITIDPEWVWFQITQPEPLEWTIWRGTLDRMLIACVNAEAVEPRYELPLPKE